MNTSTSNSISHSFVHHKNFLQKRVQESLFMEPTSQSEVYNALASLKTVSRLVLIIYHLFF